jgi:hypothetical protein
LKNEINDYKFKLNDVIELNNEYKEKIESLNSEIIESGLYNNDNKYQ